ncbi:fungal-specific transcription factor domain-containing protein [Xylariomycetidae sp. FL2044]|nr:fungal-specific transcription factor domain-containing protein [Xylariomycetidae sp. FL2044]
MREGIEITSRKRKERPSHDSYETSTPPSSIPSKRWKATSAHSENGTPLSPGRVAVRTVCEILRDLSIQASGGYIGASSQISMGRMISAIVQAKEYNVNQYTRGGWEHLSPKSANSSATAAPATVDREMDFSQVPTDIAEKLLNSYIRHISTRWPILQTPFLRLLHSERSTISDAFFTSVLHLIYAIGGRFLETTGDTGDYYPEQHYDLALKNMDDILRLHDIRSVQFLLLLSIYSLRSPRGPGAWTYTGLAMRQCIEMGLHRKAHRQRSSILEYEMSKRVFWTCYCLDRQVSIILGRPFAISDQDIDVGLPLDIDESNEDLEALEEVRRRGEPGQDAPAAKSTSMTGFIYLCRLRRIESEIQQSIYRVDEASPAAESEVERFIQKLEDWKALMPKDASHLDFPNMVVDGYDNYMVYFYKCMRYLLHPIILSSEMSDSKFLRKCAEACGGVCRTYKKLHQIMPIGFSIMALHSIFLAGLTLTYCVWASPKEVFSIATSNDMNACSIVLYIITERWPGARHIRDTYESIKQMLLESIEEGEYAPRRAIANLRPAAFRGIAQNSEISDMVSKMAGEPAVDGGARDPRGVAATTTAAAHADADADTTTAPQTFAVDSQTPLQAGGSSYGFSMPLDGIPLDFHEADAFNAMDMQPVGR